MSGYKEKNVANETNNENNNSHGNEENAQYGYEIIKNLNILNISHVGLILVLIAVIINIRYIEWSKIQVFDTINNTNYAQEMEDLTEAPKVTNKLYIAATLIFIAIIYDAYITQISLDESKRDIDNIRDAWKKYIAIILVFIGSLINYTVYNRPKKQE